MARPGVLRNVQIGFGLSLLLLVISSVASFSSIHNLMDSAQMVDHTDSVINELNVTLSLLKDAETGQRGYLLTSDTAFLRPYYGSRERALANIDLVQSMTKEYPGQQANARELRDIVSHRLIILESVIDQKRANNIYSLDDLQKGREAMDEIRLVVKRMQEEEHRLLAVRIANLTRYSTYTPVLIIVTALLSILITIFFYRRVYNDHLERMALYSELQAKDADIARRIDLIGDIAEEISAGHYQVRVPDDQRDGLGDLGGSLNKMAASLEYSFGVLSDREWMQGGIAGLVDWMVGETDLAALASGLLAHIAKHTHSSAGAIYRFDPATDTLVRVGSYALNGSSNRERFKMGEGFVGQVARDRKAAVLKDIPEGQWVIRLASGDLSLGTVAVFPIFHEKRLKGVIELASMEAYTQREWEYFENVAEPIGAAMNSIESRRRLQDLLERTQAQAEELQSQHGELEHLNQELEVQTEKLQVSEEELKVQQEELMQTNQELEERSRTLEEKNQLILLRNLDIQKKAEELALTTKYKSEFMANMSHELRTPLNSILLLSRLLAENEGRNLTGDQTEYARVIQNSGQGLLQLIDEILDLSRIESGKLPLEHMLVPVQELMGDMRMLFEPIAKDKNLSLHIIIEEGTPAQMETDKMRLEQILKNLLSNAFKFTHKGSVTLRVRMAPGRANFMDFIVKDTGIGIPEDKHELIFEAFQQADGSTRRKYGGTGLGLSISRELSRILGGEIHLTSQPGQGAEFIVSVPQFRMDGSAAVAGSNAHGQEEGLRVAKPEMAGANGTGGMETHHAGASTGTGVGREEWQGMRALGRETLTDSTPGVFTLSEAPDEIPDDRGQILPGDKILLIVEDDTLFAQELLDFSRKKGYKGIVAVSGDNAVRLARQFLPMGILLDIQLPVKSGWEVMDELKKDPRTRGIPVHIMSSFEVKNESLKRGAVDFLPKSSAFDNMDQAFEKIEFILGRSARKVIIVEDNIRHAQALEFFLSANDLNMKIASTMAQSEAELQKNGVHGVILSREAGGGGTETLEMVRNNPAFANVPIIVFTGMNISKAEEARLRKYADSIVVKTAHSYQRVVDEVSLFLHIVGEGRELAGNGNLHGRLIGLDEVLAGRSVLVADDDVRNIFSLTKALEQHKMKVVTAMDGKEALAAAEAGGVDIILMDMMMPEMDGFEAISRIRRNPRMRHLPIIAVTAKAMAGDRERCIQAGASDYISKPVDIDQLLSLLRIWLYEK